MRIFIVLSITAGATILLIDQLYDLRLFALFEYCFLGIPVFFCLWLGSFLGQKFGLGTGQPKWFPGAVIGILAFPLAVVLIIGVFWATENDPVWELGQLDEAAVQLTVELLTWTGAGLLASAGVIAALRLVTGVMRPVPATLLVITALGSELITFWFHSLGLIHGTSMQNALWIASWIVVGGWWLSDSSGKAQVASHDVPPSLDPKSG